jgi:hypothetical protein
LNQAIDNIVDGLRSIRESMAGRSELMELMCEVDKVLWNGRTRH